MIHHRALSLLFTLLVAVPTVAAQATVMIAFDTVRFVPSGSDCVITGKPAPSGSTSGLTCWQNLGFGSTGPGVHVVNIRPDNSIRLLDGFTSTLLPPGTRLQNLILVGFCSLGSHTYRVYSGVVANPTPSGTAFVIAPSGVTLSSDHEAVTMASDSSGNTDAVCIKKGTQAIKTKLWTDVTLTKASRLRIGLLSGNSNPSCQLTNLLYRANCSVNGDSYNIYEADVTVP